MAPSSTSVRHWRNAAHQRFEDAQILFSYDRNTGAVYLAGYGVECILKALIVASVPATRERDVLDTFSGKQGHDLERLRSTYQRESGLAIGREMVVHLARVSTWSTDLRYKPGLTPRKDAEEFLTAARAVMDWATRRLP
jgi:HEPN domain-containing protein